MFTLLGGGILVFCGAIGHTCNLWGILVFCRAYFCLQEGILVFCGVYFCTERVRF